jgi:hypothetical protein
MTCFATLCSTLMTRGALSPPGWSTQRQTGVKRAQRNSRNPGTRYLKANRAGRAIGPKSKAFSDLPTWLVCTTITCVITLPAGLLLLCEARAAQRIDLDTSTSLCLSFSTIYQTVVNSGALFAKLASDRVHAESAGTTCSSTSSAGQPFSVKKYVVQVSCVGSTAARCTARLAHAMKTVCYLC